MAGGRVLDTMSLTEVKPEAIESFIGRHDIAGIIYCSVGRMDARLVETLRHMTTAPVEVLTHTTPLPFAVDYGTPATLGLDRIADAAGARTLLAEDEGALIVDAGTCITLDVLDGSHTFRGGNISPGVDMRFCAMHAYTDSLPKVGADGDTPTFGYDTVTALRSGVLFGIAYEIAATMSCAKRLYNVSTLILTGGNASLLSYLLKDHCNNDIRLLSEPNLPDIGLELIFRHND